MLVTVVCSYSHGRVHRLCHGLLPSLTGCCLAHASLCVCGAQNGILPDSPPLDESEMDDLRSLVDIVGEKVRAGLVVAVLRHPVRAFAVGVVVALLVASVFACSLVSWAVDWLGR